MPASVFTFAVSCEDHVAEVVCAVDVAEVSSVDGSVLV